MPWPLFCLWTNIWSSGRCGSEFAFLLSVWSHRPVLTQTQLLGGPVTPFPSPPFPTVQLSVGPMARDVESLALCLKALLCENLFRLDPTVPPLPFREEVSEVGGEGGWEWTRGVNSRTQVVWAGLAGSSVENQSPVQGRPAAAAPPHMATRWRPCLRLGPLRL